MSTCSLSNSSRRASRSSWRMETSVSNRMALSSESACGPGASPPPWARRRPLSSMRRSIRVLRSWSSLLYRYTSIRCDRVMRRMEISSARYWAWKRLPDGWGGILPIASSNRRRILGRSGWSVGRRSIASFMRSWTTVSLEWDCPFSKDKERITRAQ